MVCLHKQEDYNLRNIPSIFRNFLSSKSKSNKGNNRSAAVIIRIIRTFNYECAGVGEITLRTFLMTCLT